MGKGGKKIANVLESFRRMNDITNGSSTKSLRTQLAVWLQVLNMLSSYKKQVGGVWQVLLESASSMEKLSVEKHQDWRFSKKLFVMKHGKLFFYF